MPALKFANNATALLAASITDTDLTIQVANGYGVLFPNPGVGEYFYITLVNSNGDREVVKITARSTDLLTVPTGGRGQDGTSAQSWTGGLTRVDNRLNRGALEQFIQRDGDAMNGDLDMDSNEVQNAEIVDSNMTGGQLVGTAIRCLLDDTSNEILVPNDGTRATAGGERILVESDTEVIQTAAFFVGFITDFFGIAADVPDGWHICDGTNGTPDMRGFFSRGATSDGQIGDEHGAATASITINDGGAEAAGETGATVLTEDNMPEHGHRLLVWDSGANGPGQMENFGSSTLGNAKGVAGNADANTYAYREQTQTGIDLIEDAGGDAEGHTHTTPARAAHGHTADDIAIIPPSKYLYKIMFIGF